jgi:hypothetical protein
MVKGTGIAEGSVVIRGLTAAWAGFGRVSRRVAGLAHRIDAAAGRARKSPPDPADEARVRQVLASSRLVRTIDAAIDVPPRAWRSSFVRAALEPTFRDYRSQPAPTQLRIAGWALVVATVTHIALVVAFGEPVGWPTWAAWVSFLALASVPVIWPRGVAAAWANRSPWVRRLLQESPPWQ